MVSLYLYMYMALPLSSEPPTLQVCVRPRLGSDQHKQNTYKNKTTKNKLTIMPSHFWVLNKNVFPYVYNGQSETDSCRV